MNHADQRPTRPKAREAVIDLTETKAIAGLADSVAEQIIVTETVRSDYQDTHNALARLDHRAFELLHRVFVVSDVPDSAPELQPA